MINPTMIETGRDDAELVTKSLSGNRSAFRQIVERYQTLICSIAYSATGSVSRSEDISQETFIAAWTRLGSLREPDKLRGWLCGIVRNRLHRDRREDVLEPVRRAVELEHADQTPALEESPSDQAVGREEEAILWRSLENIPPLYREPLVLFYRVHCSIEQVAAAMELSEDTVKQRLSRGRKLLQEEVQAFVETTLRRTAPGNLFSASVLIMLPAAGSAVAVGGAGLGVKGSAAAQSSLAAGWLAPLAPFLGIAAGVVAHWLVIRDTTTDPLLRRRQLAQVIIAWVAYLGLAVGGEWAVHGTALHFGWNYRLHFVALAIFWWLFITGSLTFSIVIIRRIQSRRDPSRRATADARPMRPRTLAAVAFGAHLAMFSWLIVLAWRWADPVGMALTTFVMAVLGGALYGRGRGKAGTALAQVAAIHTAIIGIALLLLLNLRTNIWVAACYGVSVAQARQVLPTWIVPVLTLALVVWIAWVIAVTRPNQRSLPRSETTN